MATLPKGRKSKKYDFLGGGLVTRPDDHFIDKLNDKGHFYSPAETNVQFTKIASMQKRLGYTQNGSTLVGVGGASSTFYSQATNTVPLPIVLAANSQKTVICQKITAGSNASVVSVATKPVIGSAAPLDRKNFTNIKCVIKSDSAGSPGTTLATSNALTDGLELDIDTNYLTTPDTLFYFPSGTALVSGTDYWICFEADASSSATSVNLAFAIGAAVSASTIKYGNNGYTGLSSIGTTSLYLNIKSTVAPVLGLYDYRPQAAGVITQFPMAACAGTLYYYAAGAYTSIATGLASSANSLYDFATLKNLLFSCDHATSNNQAWDGAAAATMAHGYRGTMSALAQSASAGGPWSAAGVVKVILVTTLRSGGLRVSSVFSITLASATNKIDLSSIAVDAIAAQFSFDIAATATTIYCTLPNGSIYYKVPAAKLSTAGNPIANTQTANSILPMTDAELIAGGSFESNTGYPQGYATGQVDTPKAKYMEVFQNMLCTAGDPNNPSRVWFSEQFAPQVWGDGSSGTGIQGDYLDIAVDDGETVTGLAVSDGALLVGKQTGLYRVQFTGNASDSWIVSPVHGEVGVLSNWSMQVIPEGLFFLSNRGPAICYGTYSDVLPQTRMIQNLFDNTSADSFNLASMIYAVAMNDTTRNQVLMTISSPSVSIRDRILSYDYEQKMFALYDGYQANYLAAIGDSNGFPVLWTGNLSGQVFKQALITSGTPYFDNGAAIIVSYKTPNIDFDDPSTYAQTEWLHIAGKVQTSGNLYIDFFASDSTTPYRTISLDMTSAKFATGLAVRIGTQSQTFSFRIRSVDFTGVSGMELHWIRLEFSNAGGTRLG